MEIHVFTVVGEDKADTDRLLVLSDDGRYFDYFPAGQRFTPVEPDREWFVYAHRDPHAAGQPRGEVYTPGTERPKW